MSSAFLQPLWNILVRSAEETKEYEIQMAPFRRPTVPLHIPFTHTNIKNQYVRYTCTIPRLHNWVIYVQSPHQIHVGILKLMFLWLLIVKDYCHAPCLKYGLDVIFHPIAQHKHLPAKQGDTIGRRHINSAYTQSCKERGEIVIFRAEECLKVLIHETMHAGGFDFSSLSVPSPQIQELFPGLIASQPLHLYEAYSEWWARIWSILFAQYVETPNKQKISISERLRKEQAFAMHQATRVMQHSDIQLSDALKSYGKRMQYEEDTNVLSYYVLTAIMLFHSQEVLTWCSSHTNSTVIFQFSNDSADVQQFQQFVRGLIASSSICSEMDAINSNTPLYMSSERFDAI